MPLYTASSLESLLVFVVIVLLSGASNWLKKRQEQKDGTFVPPTPRPPPVPGTPSPPPPVSTLGGWEEELRRLLEGEPPVPPPGARPTPPPPLVTARQAPTQAPPTRQAQTPPPSLPPEEEVKPLPVPTSSPVRFPETERALDLAPAPAFNLAKFVQTAKAHERAQHLDSDAYGRASNLDERTAYRLRYVVDRTQNPLASQVAPRRRGLAIESARTLAQLRNPLSARQAILASVIMAPPKALE